MFASEKAREAGLSLKSQDYREPCPKCSPNRRKKKDPCLHVTVSSAEIRAKCFHCDWGMTFTDDDPLRERRPSLRREADKPRPRQPSRWY